MNSGRAKRIAKLVYGDYVRRPDKFSYQRNVSTGQILRDDKRRMYQAAKKLWTQTKGDDNFGTEDGRCKQNQLRRLQRLRRKTTRTKKW